MRLIDAEALASDLMERWNTADEDAEKEIIAVLANIVTPILVGQPTVDAVEVVRCRDCIHWFPHTQCGFDEDNDEYHDYCGLLIPDDDYYAYTRKPDDYCSCGERREDGEE